MHETALVTVASGFLGTRIVQELLARTSIQIYVLVRAKEGAEVHTRLTSLWWEHPELVHELDRRIIPLAGDITKAGLAFAPETRAQLPESLDFVIHSAADVSINQTKETLWRVNVEGTRNVLDFAGQMAGTHPLKKFIHVSTAYVAGERRGSIAEESLINKGFNSLYEQSKYEAELLVRACADKLPVCIARPSQIVGDSRTGEISTFNTVYYPLKLYLKGELRILPISRQQKMNIVPVDYVASSIVRLLADETATGKTFHLVLPPEQQPTAGELLEAVRVWAHQNLGLELPRLRFLPLRFLSTLGRSHNLQEGVDAKKKSKRSNILALAPYFFEDRVFDTSNCSALLKNFEYTWQEALSPLLSFAVQKGFLNHTGRTVFEQMLVRLSSSKNTIEYFDVGASGITRFTPSEARERIGSVCRALDTLGIKAHDRVAVAGINSSNYFALDAAIGLVGATSVPLYYTSPPEDITALLKASDSKVLFVDSERVFSGLSQIAFEGPIISMSRGNHAPTLSDPGREVMSWETFLALGTDAQAASVERLSSASYEDIATIRYTSGTTGQPKGVIFNQGQLKWMGETLPSLLDWKTRNGTIRYLSFLPMSHVVEGILVAYAPYYILSNIEIYYLNDFDALTESLPKVRPTIFFSVPRFYEKVWNQFVDSSAGAYYLKLREGSWKRLIAKVCKTVLLRKAGLNKCRQLIVGSAPVSLELLEQFRGLGVEIHNAYGLTEAPLITLSRRGSNELGSVGALLPETLARIDESGEIHIKGPQVTVGYDGQDEPVVDSEGYFATGDFGSFSPKGNLVMGGRKKEVLITSYGKNINPQKIETLLKDIPLVSEALLVGEGFPYCTALLWVEGEAKEFFNTAELDAAVERINTQLSNPERVKRWVVMSDDLKIAAGELTPNLKLRRDRILINNQEIVDALYKESLEEVSGVLYHGATL